MNAIGDELCGYYSFCNTSGIGCNKETSKDCGAAYEINNNPLTYFGQRLQTRLLSQGCILYDSEYLSLKEGILSIHSDLSTDLPRKEDEIVRQMMKENRSRLKF